VWTVKGPKRGSPLTVAGPALTVAAVHDNFTEYTKLKLGTLLTFVHST